jgi:hypothetical protein
VTGRDSARTRTEMGCQVVVGTLAGRPGGAGGVLESEPRGEKEDAVPRSGTVT